jgi:tetratricopeptide (TPR) repeat protein
MAFAFQEPLQRLVRRLLMGKRAAQAAGSDSGRSLPGLPDLGQFTYRADALASLRSVLRPNGALRTPAALITIHGRPGCGKSALAIQLAHEMHAAYPQAQLYVDLKGASSTQEPLQPADVLRRLLSQLGSTPPSPSRDEGRLADAYRAQLRGKSAIVVLDNAAEESQVTPLLPQPPGCLVVITSRRSLDGLTGSTRYCLGTMGEPESLALLKRVAGDRVLSAEDEPQAAILARLCGHLPLALEIAGNQLRSQQVAELVSRLEDPRTRLHELHAGRLDVRRSFGVSYQRLADQERALFRRLRLPVVEPSFDAGIAAALLGGDPDAAAAALARLADEQLVLPAEDGSHRFAELMGLYADERLDQDEPAAERAAASRRVLGVHLAEAEARVEELDPAISDLDARQRPPTSLARQLEALDWYERKAEKLARAWRQAEELGAHDVAWRLAACVGPFAGVRGSLREWSEMQKAALAAAKASAKATGDLYAEAWAELSTGQVLRFTGDLDGALGHLREARDRADACGWRRLEARALHLMGCVERRRRRLDEALVWYHGAAEIFAEEGMLHELAATVLQVTTAVYEQGKISTDDLIGLARSMRAALEAFPEEVWTIRTIGKVDEYLARVALANGNLETAGACCFRALAAYNRIGFRHGQARARRELGRVRQQQRLWEPAHDYLEESAALFRTIEDAAAAAHVEALLVVLGQERLRVRAEEAPADTGPSTVPSTAATSARRPGIFVSYSKDDAETADRIARQLSDLGHPVWYAPWSIRAGESIAGKINEALRQNNTLLALLSPRSVTSRWVTLEWESALAMMNAEEDMRVVPVLIDPVQMPPILLGIKHIDMTARRFDAGFAELEQILADR